MLNFIEKNEKINITYISTLMMHRLCTHTRIYKSSRFFAARKTNGQIFGLREIKFILDTSALLAHLIVTSNHYSLYCNKAFFPALSHFSLGMTFWAKWKTQQLQWVSKASRPKSSTLFACSGRKRLNFSICLAHSANGYGLSSVVRTYARRSSSMHAAGHPPTQQGKHPCSSYIVTR